MGIFSLLPEPLSAVEHWVTRLFLVLATITFGPWVLILVYDLIFYIARTAAYEIPFIGGRARGRARPRAPSLTERPSGQRRKLSLAPRPEPVSNTIRSEVAGARRRLVRIENEDDSAIEVS